MKKQTLIKKINAAVPEALATDAIEFYGRKTSGIWLRGSESIAADYHSIFDYYNDCALHPKIEKLIKKAGWYVEPYDAGTAILYPDF